MNSCLRRWLRTPGSAVYLLCHVILDMPLSLLSLRSAHGLLNRRNQSLITLIIPIFIYYLE